MTAPRVKLHPLGRAVVEVAPDAPSTHRRWIALWIDGQAGGLDLQSYEADEVEAWPDYSPPYVSTSVPTDLP